MVEQRNNHRRRGLFIKLPSVEVVELVASSAFDFAVVDLEHSALSERDALRLVRHGAALGFELLVRLPEIDRGAVNRLLEAGARGIQLSMVRRAAEVRELRDAMQYPPDGTRSISLAHRGAAYGVTPLAAYLRDAAAQPALAVIQIETVDTVDSLGAILNEGPDVVFIGTTDLRVDAEARGGVGYDERVEEIAAATAAAGIRLGAFALNDPRVAYDLVSSDLALLASAVRASPASL